jgi:hypothetical protein
MPGIALLFIFGGTAYAQYSSSNYKANEVYFSSGAGTGSSTNYQSQQSLGSLGVGRFGSASFQSYPGTITPQYPYLEFAVNATSTNVGVLSTTAPTTTTGSFYVKTYLASGYVVTNASPPPKNGSYTMSALTSPTTSSVGNEQFGMNLVANNSCPQSGMPASLGADPVQVPSGSFSFGAAGANYATPCQFEYKWGGSADTVALSSSSSGETDYTISYLYNISSLTPGGKYNFDHILVATSTY